MKIRTGFVSNSSSSSFVCDVCGGVESGFDASLSDFEMSECENGHVYCDSHGIEPSKEDLESVESENENEDYEEDFSDGDPVPDKYCPICQLTKIQDHVLLAYLLKKSKKSREQIEAEFRKKYKTLADWIKVHES